MSNERDGEDRIGSPARSGKEEPRSRHRDASDATVQGGTVCSPGRLLEKSERTAEEQERFDSTQYAFFGQDASQDIEIGGLDDELDNGTSGFIAPDLYIRGSDARRAVNAGGGKALRIQFPYRMGGGQEEDIARFSEAMRQLDSSFAGVGVGNSSRGVGIDQQQQEQQTLVGDVANESAFAAVAGLPLDFELLAGLSSQGQYTSTWDYMLPSHDQRSSSSAAAPAAWRESSVPGAMAVMGMGTCDRPEPQRRQQVQQPHALNQTTFPSQLLHVPVVEVGDTQQQQQQRLQHHRTMDHKQYEGHLQQSARVQFEQQQQKKRPHQQHASSFSQATLTERVTMASSNHDQFVDGGVVHVGDGRSVAMTVERGEASPNNSKAIPIGDNGGGGTQYSISSRRQPPLGTQVPPPSSGAATGLYTPKSYGRGGGGVSFSGHQTPPSKQEQHQHPSISSPFSESVRSGQWAVAATSPPGPPAPVLASLSPRQQPPPPRTPPHWQDEAAQFLGGGFVSNHSHPYRHPHPHSHMMLQQTMSMPLGVLTPAQQQQKQGPPSPHHVHHHQQHVSSLPSSLIRSTSNMQGQGESLLLFPDLTRQEPPSPPSPQQQQQQPRGKQSPSSYYRSQQQQQHQHQQVVLDRSPFGFSGVSGGSRFRNNNFRSKYMTVEEIESIVRIQWTATHTSDPYTDDYYNQAMQAKLASSSPAGGGGNPYGRRHFAPSHLRELPPHARAAAEPHAYLQVAGLGRVPFSSIRRPRPLLEMDADDLLSSNGERGGTVGAGEGGSEERARQIERLLLTRRLDQEPMLAARSAVEDGMCLLLDVDDIDRVLALSQPADGGLQLRRRRQALLDGLAASLHLRDPMVAQETSRSLTQSRAGAGIGGGDGGGIIPRRAGVDAAADARDTKDDLIFLRLVSLPKGRKLLARFLHLLMPGTELLRIVVMSVMRDLRFLFGGKTVDPSLLSANASLSTGVASAVGSMDLPSLSACLAAVVISQELPPLRRLGSAAGDGATVILKAVLERASVFRSDRVPMQHMAMWHASFDVFFSMLVRYWTDKIKKKITSTTVSTSASSLSSSPSLRRSGSGAGEQQHEQPLSAAASAGAAGIIASKMDDDEMPLDVLHASNSFLNDHQRNMLLEAIQGRVTTSSSSSSSSISGVGGAAGGGDDAGGGVGDVKTELGLISGRG